MSKGLVIIVVPGGMGTTLSLGKTRVWDFDPTSLHFDGMRMLIDPAFLVPWLALQPGRLLSAYDDLSRFLVKSGYTKQQDLFLWGYDWRQGMARNAQELATFVTNIQQTGKLAGKKILFIAHSCGCMIVRWALANGNAPLINTALVDSVVAAGPPMLGMASPFKDIIRMPRLNDTFDALFGVLQLLYPELADQVSVPLTRILMTVTAQLEGLPPNTLPILSGGSTMSMNPYGVFNWPGWPDELDSLLAAVQATQTALQAAPLSNVNCTVVASNSHPTDTGYVLDTSDQYQSDWPTGAGDDSVLFCSAQAYCPGGDLLLVGERHRTLLDDPDTRTLLSSII